MAMKLIAEVHRNVILKRTRKSEGDLKRIDSAKVTLLCMLTTTIAHKLYLNTSPFSFKSRRLLSFYCTAACCDAVDLPWELIPWFLVVFTSLWRSSRDTIPRAPQTFITTKTYAIFSSFPGACIFALASLGKMRRKKFSLFRIVWFIQFIPERFNSWNRQNAALLKVIQKILVARRFYHTLPLYELLATRNGLSSSIIMTTVAVVRDID